MTHKTLFGINYRDPAEVRAVENSFRLMRMTGKKITVALDLPPDWQARYPLEGRITTPSVTIAREAVSSGSTIIPLTESYEKDRRLATFDALYLLVSSFPTELQKSPEGVSAIRVRISQDIALLETKLSHAAWLNSEDTEFHLGWVRRVGLLFEDLVRNGLCSPADALLQRENAALEYVGYALSVIRRENPNAVVVSILSAEKLRLDLPDYSFWAGSDIVGAASRFSLN